jgi:hypothetical protein
VSDIAVMSTVSPAHRVLQSPRSGRAQHAGDTVRAAECWKPHNAEHCESGACPPE